MASSAVKNEVSGDIFTWSETTGVYYRLLEITRDYWSLLELLQVTRDYWRLIMVRLIVVIPVFSCNNTRLAVLPITHVHMRKTGTFWKPFSTSCGTFWHVHKWQKQHSYSAGWLMYHFCQKWNNKPKWWKQHSWWATARLAEIIPQILPIILFVYSPKMYLLFFLEKNYSQDSHLLFSMKNQAVRPSSGNSFTRCVGEIECDLVKTVAGFSSLEPEG